MATRALDTSTCTSKNAATIITLKPNVAQMPQGPGEDSRIAMLPTGVDKNRHRGSQRATLVHSTTIPVVANSYSPPRCAGQVENATTYNTIRFTIGTTINRLSHLENPAFA